PPRSSSRSSCRLCSADGCAVADASRRDDLPMSTTPVKPAAPAAPVARAAPTAPDAPATTGGGTSRPGVSTGPHPALRVISAGCTLLGLFILGFVGYLYGASNLQEARAQRTFYATLRLELANQVAPLAA